MAIQKRADENISGEGGNFNDNASSIPSGNPTSFGTTSTDGGGSGGFNPGGGGWSGKSENENVDPGPNADFNDRPL